MEIDQSEDEIERRSDVLRNLSAKGPLPTSMAKLSGSSRIIPSRKDFHFYNNFQEFKNPVQEFDRKSKALLEKIGASEDLFGKPIPLPDDKDVELDDDVAIDWLVNVNDEIFERFDVSLDDFKRLRQNEEETGVRTMGVDGEDENGFQMVYGKKNKKSLRVIGRNADGEVKGVQEVKVAPKLKAKVPFHVPTITKPQDEYKIIVNNSNQPFDHVWLKKSEDGSRFLHPLEKLCVLDFIDESDTEPKEPLPIEVTPFTFVQDVKDLKQLAIKLRNVNEFAVDLEHNQYRSFQGLTCLMQISTRTEDFIIDTLKLRIHIGPYLREVFKDPSKRKVLHGADRDIIWLERDFGIYVCNMFDTGQASRVLKMERFSLEHLLNHFCGVTANKEYQNADWRIRPLPYEMIKYAREDTHYLLYIYDLMRIRLLKLTADSESADPPLIEVYKRSYDICTQLYEKELLTEASYLHIYGVQSADLNAQQLAVASGLYEWRDVVARAEDESTGYVLPNRTLIEIAKQMPLTTGQLRRILKSKLPYIERNLGSVVSIIRHSIQNVAAFEETAKLLKERRLELANEANNTLASEETEALLSDATDEILKNAEEVDNIQHITSPKVEKGKTNDYTASDQRGVLPVHGDPKDRHTTPSLSHSAEATVQLLKKPNRAFGALFGNSSKRKFRPDRTEEEDTKLEQIKSTVSLPFHSFPSSDDRIQTNIEESAEKLETPHPASAPAATGSTLEDIIVLDIDSDVDDDSGNANSDMSPNTQSKQEALKNEESSGSEGDEPMSLSELSTSFQKCLPSPGQTSNKSLLADGFLQVKPFDYEAARKQVNFGGHRGGEAMEGGDSNNRRRDKKKGSVTKEKKSKDEGSDFGQGKRRQAFPASGNRSATFR